MEVKYLFDDWTSLSKMRNSINPSLKVRTDVIVDNNEVQGYFIKIYDKDTCEIIYSVGLEINDEYSYSLTTTEMVDMLNLIGFNCEYTAEFEISDETKDMLTNIYELGYTTLIKEVRPSRVTVIRLDSYGRPEYKDLKEITEYNYQEFFNLPVDSKILIKGLID